MGCTASDSGISLQFCNKDGSPDGHPIYGRYAVLFGLEQEKLLCEKGSTPDEQRFKGSDDWLTIIAVADSPEKLQDIIDHTPPAVCVPAHTSGSSHRACIELHIGAIRKSFRDRITIASGPITSFPPRPIKMDVVHVKVLPAETTLTEIANENPDNTIIKEFAGNAITLETLSE